MEYHILNGDALAEKFPSLQGQVIVMREAFMDGPVSASFDAAYWAQRMSFVAEAFDADAADYWTKFGSQLVMMREIADGDEVYLWFEDDLFCIVNMMVAVHYIWLHSNPVLYRVYPASDAERWSGFAKDDAASLQLLFEKKVRLEEADMLFLKNWWKAYVENDVNGLRNVALTETKAMRFAKEVTEAHVARLHADPGERQPLKLLDEIRQSGVDKFEDVFAEFSKRAGVYGYGDVQVKRILGSQKNLADTAAP